MLAVALVLDALVGERMWERPGLLHPIILIGRLIGWLDQRLNRGTQRRIAGVLALGIALSVGLLIALAIGQIPFAWLPETLLAAVLLAHRSLVDHVRAVATGLRRSLEEGRSAVSMIVGRDPGRLDEAGVSRAAIESAAENFSDGVVAPAFWFVIAGLPGIVAYKIVNTADSMIGHRTERYAEFGWASARLDDLLNWVPARLTGGLICLVGGGRTALTITRRDAGQHRSPNAGWPEAAMAASLDLALAGPRDYGTHKVDDPFMNRDGRLNAAPDDIDLAIRLLWRAWAVLVLVAALLALLLAL